MTLSKLYCFTLARAYSRFCVKLVFACRLCSLLCFALFGYSAPDISASHERSQHATYNNSIIRNEQACRCEITDINQHTRHSTSKHTQAHKEHARRLSICEFACTRTASIFLSHIEHTTHSDYYTAGLRHRARQTDRQTVSGSAWRRWWCVMNSAHYRANVSRYLRASFCVCEWPCRYMLLVCCVFDANNDADDDDDNDVPMKCYNHPYSCVVLLMHRVVCRPFEVAVKRALKCVSLFNRFGGVKGGGGCDRTCDATRRRVSRVAQKTGAAIAVTIETKPTAQSMLFSTRDARTIATRWRHAKCRDRRVVSSHAHNGDQRSSHMFVRVVGVVKTCTSVRRRLSESS